MRVEEEIQVLSNRFLKTIEENCEITSSIKELERVNVFNEGQFKEKSHRLKHLRSSLIRWTHESEISSLSLSIDCLQSTMDNNTVILDSLRAALTRNIKTQEELQHSMINLLASHSSNASEVARDMSQACSALKTEKAGLENVNQEIKQ